MKNIYKKDVIKQKSFTHSYSVDKLRSVVKNDIVDKYAKDKIKDKVIVNNYSVGKLNPIIKNEDNRKNKNVEIKHINIASYAGNLALKKKKEIINKYEKVEIINNNVDSSISAYGLRYVEKREGDIQNDKNIIIHNNIANIYSAAKLGFDEKKEMKNIYEKATIKKKVLLIIILLMN